ncbi:YbaK/EbsC family protein [Nakamurella endophytica]|nr:YbaK/EbsC family protein [Nakamurella endophytica]
MTAEPAGPSPAPAPVRGTVLATVLAAAFPALDAVPVLDRPDLVAEPVLQALRRGDLGDPAHLAVLVAAIDPALADTAAFCAAYDVPAERSANCVVVSGRREGEVRWAAAVVLATTRADVNGAVRRRMDVRKVSFGGHDETVAATAMEYGGITPVGLPAGWPVLVDSAVAAAGPVVIGSGVRGSKLVLDGASLGALPTAEVLDGLGRPVPAAP